MYLIKYKFTKFMTLSNLAVFFAVQYGLLIFLEKHYINKWKGKNETQ